MKLKELAEIVCEANLELNRRGLVVYTWGNVSGIDRESGTIAIKPSGVPYSKLVPSKIVMLSYDSGRVIKGDANPSSDTPTHLVLYRRFPTIGGVSHTHSPYATAFAQAMRPIPCLGTTHADYFYGEIPVTRKMWANEIEKNYELNTGKIIAELWTGKEKRALEIPAALVLSHGPFTWGKSASHAVENAVVMEEIAKIAATTFALNPKVQSVKKELLDKHYLRKHGSAAYYGQKTK